MKPRAGAVLVLTTACAAICPAQPADQITAASVVVFAAVQENGKAVPISRAGGFLVDSRHVVTNLASCCGKSDRGQQSVPVVVAGQEGGIGKVIWSSEEIALAVVELDKPINRGAAGVSPIKFTQKGQPVYTVQFPDPGKDGPPQVTEGRIDGTATMEGTQVQLLKSSAAMNRANAGGALFDACGNAVGINVMTKDGALYSFAADPLIDGLDAAGVKASVASGGCGGSGSGGKTTSGGGKPKAEKGESKPGEWRLPQGSEWVGVVLIVGFLALAFRPSARQKMARALARRATAPEPVPYPYQASPQPAPPASVLAPPPAAVHPAGKPSLRGITGQYAGASIELAAGPSTLGRDPRSANLVFPPETDSVSKRHCTVSWDAARRTFVLQDHGSTNGTFLSTGERLSSHQPRDLRPGDRFYIGDLRNQFEVGFEE
jgi:hypothetical protein